MQHLNLTRLKRSNPKLANEIWKLLKQHSPAQTALLTDSLTQECQALFNAEIELPMNELPVEVIERIKEEG